MWDPNSCPSSSSTWQRKRRSNAVTRKEDAGVESFAGALAQCPALAHLDLSSNGFGDAGTEILAGVLEQCGALVHLHLRDNWIAQAGAESFATVLTQCTALAHLGLNSNRIDNAGTESLARVLVQCPALAQLELWGNEISDAGAESLAEVLAQCTALATLELRTIRSKLSGKRGFELRGVHSQKSQSPLDLPLLGYHLPPLQKVCARFRRPQDLAFVSHNTDTVSPPSGTSPLPLDFSTIINDYIELDSISR